MKVKITEAQNIFLKENGVQVYHDDVQQYSSNGTEVKHFYTTINGEDIEWQSSNQNLQHYDIDYHNHPCKLGVDWSCQFMFDENGFTFQPVVNSVKGKIYLTCFDPAVNSEPIEIDVDSKRGWKLSIENWYFGDDKTAKVKSLSLNLDSKIIEIG